MDRMVSKSKRVSDIVVSSLLLVLVLGGFVKADLVKDRQECAEKLIGLASCVPYVDGETENPTIDCCTGLKVVLQQSKKCICILIKDRNDPNLGIKINASLAIHLPTACHSPANITQCVDLLHLAPNSPDAKVFEGFQKSAKTNSSSTTPVSTGAGGAEKGSSSSADDKSDATVTVSTKRWQMMVSQLLCTTLPFLFFLV